MSGKDQKYIMICVNACLSFGMIIKCEIFVVIYSIDAAMSKANGNQEITAIHLNKSHIIEVVTVGSNLQWFAEKLVEKGFIHQQVSSEILSMQGIEPEGKVGRLLDSVFTVLRNADRKERWFGEFNAIFLKQESDYMELVDKLRRTYREGTNVVSSFHITMHVVLKLHMCLFYFPGMWKQDSNRAPEDAAGV